MYNEITVIMTSNIEFISVFSNVYVHTINHPKLDNDMCRQQLHTS